MNLNGQHHGKRKAGCPEGNQRVMSVLADHIETSAKERKRCKKMFCSICNKFNHNSNETQKNPGNYEEGKDNNDEGEV